MRDKIQDVIGIPPMWVKICGNTNLEDASLAAELGADAVGFVFAESKRQVTPEQVARITPHLPANVERVGVFYSRDAAEIAEAARQAGITAVQLHGGFEESLVQQLTDRFAGKVDIIQTLHWVVEEGNAADSVCRLADEIGCVTASRRIDRILVDSKVGSAGGGTGIPFDWEAARAAFQAAPDGVRLIVAGGLNPANVARAITRLRPWGVDVSSGVEASPGRKDPNLLAQFIQNARGAETP